MNWVCWIATVFHTASQPVESCSTCAQRNLLTSCSAWASTFFWKLLDHRGLPLRRDTDSVVLVVELDELQLLSLQALSGSSLFVAQRLARRVLDLVRSAAPLRLSARRGADPCYLIAAASLLSRFSLPAVGTAPCASCRSAPSRSGCSFTSCRSALSRSGSFFSVHLIRPSTCSGSSCAVPMALHGFLAGPHLPFSCAFGPHKGYASVSTLRETAWLWQPSSRAAPGAGNRRPGTLRTDSTTSRRGALFVVASSSASSVLVPDVHSAKLFKSTDPSLSALSALASRLRVPPRLESFGCALDSSCEPPCPRSLVFFCSWALCWWSVSTSRPGHACV